MSDHHDIRRRSTGSPDPMRTWKPTRPIRSVVAGAAGTATMTLAYGATRRLRAGVRGELDYDDGPVPGEIVATVLRLDPVSGCRHRELGVLLRWSYGPAFGLVHGVLHRGLPEPWASTAFGVTVMTSTLTLFPLLGHTPPPWRWSAGVLATSLGTHAAYVAGVAAAAAALAHTHHPIGVMRGAVAARRIG
jgi:hypothetical protein